MTSPQHISAAEPWRVDLPWPAEPLHPNKRPYWAVKAKATKKARADARSLARDAKLPRIDASAIKVTCIFSPPLPKRNRDLDNLIAACKAYFDGIADAIGVNDSCFRHQEPVWGIPTKGGKVSIILEAA
jgi:crossover junction endodeoxyribonuclease RusA